MILRYAALLMLITSLLTGCDESVKLEYPTRAEAEADGLFARGWLPEIIPASAEDISMRNDLDLNISKGVFKFDPSHHNDFIKNLKRMPQEDKDGSAAYSYEDWIFWINERKDSCQFYMRLSHNNKKSEQDSAHQPATAP